MIRSKPVNTSLSALLACVAVLAPAFAQQPPPTGERPSQTPGGKGAPPGEKPGSGSIAGPAAGSAATMQIKKELTGDFSYRFVSGAEQGTAPVALPSAPSAENRVPIPIPANIDPKTAQLEILDNGRGNLARLPITTSGVTSLTEGSFKYVQAVFVPVQSKGRGVYGVQVTLTSADKKYNKSWLLKQADNGVAQFAEVPLGQQVQVAVTSGGNPPKSQSETIPLGHPADGYHWQPIEVDWPDVKTVAAPPAPAATATPSGAPGGNESHAPREPDNRSQETNTGNGGGALSNLVNVVISLLFLAGLAYLAIWAFNKGHIKTLLDKAGINISAPAATGPAAPGPFDKPAQPPLQPITEGTADPLVGGVGVGLAAAPVVSTGPRLVATMGTYAGSIFPIAGATADIGRDTGNAVPLPNDTNASRRHATLQVGNGEYMLVDNGSSNGTFVNGVRIASQTPQALRPGDEIQIGMTRFRFEA
jgi:hypothetical protein